MFRKICLFILSLSFLFTVVSCNNDKGLFGKKSAHDANSLVIAAFDGGMGLEYLEEIAKAYTNVYGVKVEIDPFYDYSTVENKIKGETYVADLIFNVTNNTGNGAKGYYLALDDIYESTPTEQETKTIKEKLGSFADDYCFEGHYYEVPHTMGYTGIFYNQTSLDTIYGTEDYTLPVTTDELIAMCNDIKTKGTGWGFVHTNSNDAEYYVFLRDALTTQYIGYEQYSHYFEGEIKDQTGNWVKATTAEELNASMHDARLAALEVCSTLVNYDNGYTPRSCKTMDFNQAQSYFWGVTSKTDKRPVAFMVNGDWLYNEIKSMAGAKAADIKMMRTPIISAIIDELDTVENDEQLAECVRYIDSVLDEVGGISKPSYISNDDLARLTEARKLITSTHTQQSISIPFNTKHQTDAENFIKFFASDDACRIYSKYEQGMYSPFSHEISDEASINNFVRSVNAVTKTSIACPQSGKSTRYTIFGGLSFFSYIWFTRNLNTGTTPETILASFEGKVKQSWSDIQLAVTN